MPPKNIHRSRLRHRGGWVAILVLFIATAALAEVSKEWIAQNQNKIFGIEQRLGELEQTVERLKGRYVEPFQAKDSSYFERRWAGAQKRYQNGDYIGTTVYLADLLKLPETEKRPEHYEILWLMGDSLIRSGNMGAAKEYMVKVISFGAGHPRFHDAGMRLIEIAVEEGDFKTAQHYYDMIKPSGQSEGWDLIQYTYAKFLYKSGDLTGAYKTFSELPETSVKYAEAQYFLGVILVRQHVEQTAGKTDPKTLEASVELLNKAIQVFTRLADREATTESDLAVRDLSNLALGRIYFEMAHEHAGAKKLASDRKDHDLALKEGQQERDYYAKALTHYRRIPVESHFFDQACYETAWVYIELGKYAEAVMQLKMLLSAMPESLYAPDVQLLIGNIQLWDNKFDDAEESYGTVVTKYGQIVDEMDVIIKEGDRQPPSYLYQQVGKNSPLLPIVMGWLGQDEEMARAIQLTKDLESIREETIAARRRVQTLRKYLEQDAKANLFPELKDAHEKGVEVRNELTLLRQKLIETANEIVGDKVPEADRQRLVEVQKRRRHLEEVYANIPKTAQERNERRRDQVVKLEHFQAELAKIRVALKTCLDLIDKNLKEYEKQLGEPYISKERLQAFKDENDMQRAKILDMLKEVEELEHDVAITLEEARIGDEASRQDELIRQELEKTMAEEKELIDRMRNALSPEGVEMLDRIEKAKLRADRLEEGVNTYFATMEKAVAEWVADYDAKLEMEEKALAEYEKELNSCQTEATELAGQMARSNLRRVRDHFNDLVLRANVGIVDVTWERRQKIREERDRMQREKQERDAEAQHDLGIPANQDQGGAP